MTRPGWSAPRRALLAALAAVVALGLLLAPPAVPQARAATPDLTIVSNARYDVEPEEKRVRVTVNLLATNRLENTATRRYYFDRAFLAVPPGATGFKLTSPTGSPSVRVSQNRTGYQILALTFGQRINAGRNARFQLTFELADAGGEATRTIRVGTALVAFPVWAYASEETPGSTVTVVFPKGFAVQVEAGEVPEPKVDDSGRTIVRTGKLDDPLSFFAYLVADREADYAESELVARIGGREATITIRSWPDDPDWKDRVTDLFGRGLPALQTLIGLPWDREDPLVVQEAVSRTTGGFAGLFDPREGRIDVAYHAGAFVILHEAAHVWFNGGLLADRWANEAFASHYAEQAGEELGETVAAAELTDELRTSAFPLNAWTAAGGDPTLDDYGYAASVVLARELADRAGHDGLRRVWQAVAAGETAYQAPAVDPAATRPPERSDAPVDWRGLLDLLEERTGQPYHDLWREWVVRDEEVGLLAERGEARRRYEAAVRAAGRWELPAPVRAALRAWEFDTATALLDDVESVLDRRAELESAAEAAGLRLPARLETVFESPAGAQAAHAEAEAEQATIEILAGAAAARPTSPDALQQLGLLGETPDVRLAAAREAFAAGELERAARDAIGAQAIWQGSWEIGRNRLLVGIGVALLILLGILLLVSTWRGRRRGRAAVQPAATPLEPPVAGDAASGGHP